MFGRRSSHSIGSPPAHVAQQTASLGGTEVLMRIAGVVPPVSGKLPIDVDFRRRFDGVQQLGIATHLR
jgi:hypothetical protein